MSSTIRRPTLWAIVVACCATLSAVTLVHPEYDNPDHVELRTTGLWRAAFGSD